MGCINPVIHTIQAGDTLFSLARKYETTVAALLELNPGIDVYNLQIGSQLLVICPTVGPQPPIGTLPTPTELITEVLLLVLCWVREQFGEEPAHDVIQSLCNKLNDLGNYCPAR